ncbi:hypothetical protein J4732_06025 [Serratia marcescens]|uniref:Uncharacterized protein n=1 Tax=Serratia marcescens TaxID=615 RepID=A0A939SUH8_SERMA|nr:hypothetical protein [Serratia marcescens]
MTACGARLYAAVRDGEQRRAVTEAFIRSARQHACDHLPFVRAARPTARPAPKALTGV